MKDTYELIAIKELALALLEEVEWLAEDRDQAEEFAEGDFYEMVREYEKLLIRRALVKAHGNQALAARMLRLKPTTLNNKMKVLNLSAGHRAPAFVGGVVIAGDSESCSQPQATPNGS
jgi:transcriptional regulator with PAS, ATPase and Fis domain